MDRVLGGVLGMVVELLEAFPFRLCFHVNNL